MCPVMNDVSWNDWNDRGTPPGHQYPISEAQNNKTTNPHEDLLEFLNNRFDRDYVEPNVACFFSPSSVQWQLMASTCQVQCPGQRVGKCIAGDFSVRIPWNCMQWYEITKLHEDFEIIWNSLHHELQTWKGIHQSVLPEHRARNFCCGDVSVFVHWFDDFTPWPLPKGAEYKVHRYFLEAFEQVPKHLGNPR